MQTLQQQRTGPEKYEVANLYLSGTNTQRCSWPHRVALNCKAEQPGTLPSDGHSATACHIFVTQQTSDMCVVREDRIDYARDEGLPCDEGEFAS